MSVVIPDFSFTIPTRVEFGQDKFRMTGKLARGLGKKVLIVSSKGGSLKNRVGECRELLEKEGIKSVTFEEAVTNPSFEIMDRGRDLALRENCDLVIGLGGGSAMDVAKAIAVTVPENLGIWEVVEERELTAPPLPMIAIPTTSGTGAEATQFAVISNPEKKQKEGIGKTEFYPLLSIIDPMLTMSMPPGLTAAVGLDALTHAIEGYTTRFASPVTDALAERSIELAGRSLRRAVFNGKDLEARSEMMLSSTLAGMTITHADSSLAHVIGEAVGAVFGIHHGLAVSLILPAVMEYNCFTNVQKFKKITELMEGRDHGLPDLEAAKRSPSLVRQLIYDLDVPRGLAALGVKLDRHVIDLCVRPGWDDSNMRPASREDYTALLEGSLSPEMSYWKIKS